MYFKNNGTKQVLNTILSKENSILCIGNQCYENRTLPMDSTGKIGTIDNEKSIETEIYYMFKFILPE